MALCERQQDVDRRRFEYPAALVCSVLANINRQPNSRTYRPEDFMPHARAGDRPARVTSSGDDLFGRIDAMASRCGLNNAGEKEAQRLAREAAGKGEF